MPRTRAKQISESVAELEELRRAYRGKAEEQRLFFLQLLAEDAKRTISEAARTASISDRRGRYWWDSYRKGGLQGLLDRRVWRREELWDSPESDSSNSSPLGSQDHAPNYGALIPFVTKLTQSVAKSIDWQPALREIKQILESDLPGVDLVGVNLQWGLDVFNPGSRRNTRVAEMSLEDGRHHSSGESSQAFEQPHEQFLDTARKAGLDLSKYHEPHCFDFFLDFTKRRIEPTDEKETYVGTMVLLASKTRSDVPESTVNLLERLRPFLAFLLTDLVMRQNLRINSGAPLYDFIHRITGENGLTDQESRVLTLGFLGRSYKEMADLMTVSVSTVQSHIRSLFRKTGVSRMAELHARFYSGSIPDMQLKDLE